MALLERLRGRRSADVAESVRHHDGDEVDAVVETRPHRPRPTSRFGELEQAVAAVSRWTLRVLVVLAGLVVLYFVVEALWSIVLPVILALILSTMLWPGASFLRRFVPGALAAAVVLLLFLGAIVGIFSFLIPRVVEQAAGLGDQVVGGFEELRESLQGGFLGIPGAQIDAWVGDGLQRLQDNAQQIAGSVGTGVVSGLTSVGSALITLLLVLVLVFFFIKDGPRFLPWLHVWTGSKVAGHADEVARRVWSTLGGYIWSQAAVALVDSIFIGLGLWFLDVPFAFPLAVLVFFAAFIPIVGAVATGALAVLVALFANGPAIAVWVLVIVLVVQQLEGNVLQPLLVGRTLSLHPAVVIGAVTVGGTLAGIVGAFLAVPVAAVGTVILRYVREAVMGDHPNTGGGDAPLSADDKQEIEQRATRGEDPTEAVSAP